MNQRLFFLFPDRSHALGAVNELLAHGFRETQIHCLAQKGTPVDGLPESNLHQRQDFARRIEFWGWRANLALFFIALLALVALVVLQAGLWWLLPLTVMAATFITGERFTHMPNAHLDQFREALAHGEILVMIDSWPRQVSEAEYRVHSHHPEAVAGGSSWNLPVLGT